MSRYFTLVTACYVPRNNALNEAQEFLTSLSHRMIESDKDLQELRRDIERKIGSINKQHPRCKPIELDINLEFSDKGLCDPDCGRIMIYSQITLSIYKER